MIFHGLYCNRVEPHTLRTHRVTLHRTCPERDVQDLRLPHGLHAGYGLGHLRANLRGCSPRGAHSAARHATSARHAQHISRGRAVSCQHGAFSGVGAFVVSFVPAECPVGGGMWVIFGKPLKWAIRNTPGLHAVLTTCLRFLSALDSACVACCLFLLTGSHHVFIQIHTTCCCFP